MMRRAVIILAAAAALAVAGAAALTPGIRSQVRALVRPEPPPPITPLRVVTLPSPPPPTPTPSATATQAPTRAAQRSATPPPPSPTPEPTPPPTPTPTPGPIEIDGRLYDAYIPAATKEGQFFQYSCEFDAAWVIFATFGRDVSIDEMIAAIGIDERIEPSIKETPDGFLIYGGDIATRFSGDYRKNFLARSTGSAMRKVFEQHGLSAEPVGDRAAVEAALRRGALIWMKTTVDFKPWRPATWITPEGETFKTVLGNDHAVVAIGFNSDVVVIRDVLGPTSSNWNRPYEYEVPWETFMASWGAQDYDGLAVAPE